MADLNIKVSEEKVRETITTMTNKINSMQDHLSQAISTREKIERKYVGPTGTIAAEAIKKREKEVANSIEKFKKQRDKLQQYLDTMNTADAKAAKDFEDALNKTNELFGS